MANNAVGSRSELREIAEGVLRRRTAGEEADKHQDSLERKREEHDHPLGAWLVVRYDTADYGYRPVPDGDAFWTSPDIWVTGGTGLATIIPGVPFTMHARVWNLGNFPASPARVDFAIVDPAMGISTPQLIGTSWVPHLPGQSSAAVTCPNTWVRDDVGGGHPCLLVKASSSPMDPAPAGWVPYSDRHTGQRNLTVVPAGTSTMTLVLTTMSVLGGERLRLAVSALAGARAEDLLRPGPAALRIALAALAKASRDTGTGALRKRALLLAHMEHTAPQDVKAVDMRGSVHVKGMEGEPPMLTAQRAATGGPALLGDIHVTGDTSTQIVVDLELPDLDHLLVNLWQVENDRPTGGYSVLLTRQEVLDLAAIGTHLTGGLADA